MLVLKLRSILLVEDNPDHVLLIEEALKYEGLGKRTYVVNDGDAALDFLYHHRQYKDKASFPCPDLILLDLKIPKQSGLEVLKVIKSDQLLKHIPVVVISSSLQEADIKAAYEAGVNSYIVKPVNFEKLHRTITQIRDYWLQTNILPITNNNQ
jgi:CheY-like chemotaxis protein